MKRLAKRLLLGLLAVVGMVLLLVVGLMVFDRPHTPPIHDAEGRPLPASIATLEPITLNGLEQYILIRGHDRANPVLLFLHGGPGMPAMYLAHRFQRELERDFVVIHWDQRGAGKSYDRDLPPDSLSTERLLADTHVLIQHVQARLGVDKVVLVGHSFGSYLGLLFAARHPGLLHTYVGIGQVVNSTSSRAIQERWLHDQAHALNRPEVLDDLEARGAAAYEQWLFAFGGVLHGETSWLPLLTTGLRSPEYGFFDYFKIAPGSSFASRHMRYDTIDGPLSEHVRKVEVPILFLLGRHDYTTPSELAAAYADSLTAPSVRVVWFEQSAHFPFLEEPGLFAQTLRLLADSLR